MDLSLPEDRIVKARLLQVQELFVGQKKQKDRYTGSSGASLTLKIVVSWIEAFGILHMAWAVEGHHGDMNFEELRKSLPEKRLAFSDSFSNAGLTAVEWVREVAVAFDKHVRALDPCPVEFVASWDECPWIR